MMRTITEIYEGLEQNTLAQSMNAPIQDTKTYPISTQEIHKALEEVNEQLEIKLNNGKCSNTLKEQLARCMLQVGEVFGDRVLFFDYDNILLVIEASENREQFMKPLNGNILKSLQLDHIHHSFMNSPVKNRIKFWEDEKKKLKITNREEEITFMKSESLKLFPHLSFDKRIKAFINYMDSRYPERKLTGEWLITKTIDNRCYYLCLATHDELDEEKKERVLIAMKELGIEEVRI